MRAVKTVTGRAVVLDRPNVDTDQIIPAAWLKRVERTGFAPGLFTAWRADPEFVLNPRAAAAANLGCGSSREHAVWALQDFGFEAVIAPSFADIFRGNGIGAGLVTAQADEVTVTELGKVLAENPDAPVHVDVAERRIEVPDQGLSYSFALPDYARWRLLEGLDDIGITLRHADAVADFESRRPAWMPSSAPAVHVST